MTDHPTGSQRLTSGAVAFGLAFAALAVVERPAAERPPAVDRARLQDRTAAGADLERPRDLERLAFMAGCWEGPFRSRDGEGTIEEHATFEAPEHDYPKRILYRREGDGRLAARIDVGPGDPSPRQWTLERVPCDEAG